MLRRGGRTIGRYILSTSSGFQKQPRGQDTHYKHSSGKTAVQQRKRFELWAFVAATVPWCSYVSTAVLIRRHIPGTYVRANIITFPRTLSKIQTHVVEPHPVIHSSIRQYQVLRGVNRDAW